jgi:hypothetical protein
VKRVWVFLVCAAVLAGCGGGGGGKRGVVTFSGDFPPATETVSHDAVECARDARIFAHDALAYLAHSGPDAAYPADLYYSILHGDFADFEARRCEPKLLGTALRPRLSPRQRAALVAELPRVIADVVRDGLAATSP